jgi:hypothetical protein
MRALSPIAFRTGTTTRTFALDDAGEVVERDGAEGARTIVALSDEAWADLAGQIRTPVNLHLAGALTYEAGDFDHLAEWDPHLRHHHAGIPIYDPAAVDLRGIDVHRSFTLDDSDDELRSFLRTAGYLHVRGVFGAEAMAAANEEVDRLADTCSPGDDRSWWAVDDGGTERLCRIIYATLRSNALAALEADPSISRLGALFGPDLRRAPDRMEGSPVLLKVPGRTKGLANIPWHQDCGMGGHGVFCPNLSVGIQLTGSAAETGNLTVVPGSHGHALSYTWERTLTGVPVVEIDTEPGDVTVHVADLVHASPEPTGPGGRRTLYVTFYPPALWDHVGPGEAFNDVIRNRTQEADALR